MEHENLNTPQNPPLQHPANNNELWICENCGNDNKGDDWFCKYCDDDGYEDDENYPEVDETLFAIENNFPPPELTDQQWNKERS